MADALVAAGVKRIEGRVVGHEGLFVGERRGNDWGREDLVWSYGAEVSALSFNDNSVGLRALAGRAAYGSGRPGARSALGLLPGRVDGDHWPPGSKTDLRLTRDSGTNLIQLSGSIGIGEAPWQGWAALEDPARFAATAFAEVLEAKGIQVVGGIATSSSTWPPACGSSARTRARPWRS